jgi:hypothetical protein
MSSPKRSPRKSPRKSPKKRIGFFKAWKSPKRSERVKLHAQCPKCFLLIRGNEYKFPVCNSNCTYDCNGIHAAFVRARQFKYDEVAVKARRLLEQQCGWNPK